MPRMDIHRTLMHKIYVSIKLIANVCIFASYEVIKYNVFWNNRGIPSLIAITNRWSDRAPANCKWSYLCYSESGRRRRERRGQRGSEWRDYYRELYHDAVAFFMFVGCWCSLPLPSRVILMGRIFCTATCNMLRQYLYLKRILCVNGIVRDEKGILQPRTEW